MISIYFTDTVDIISIAVDEWGNVSKSIEAGVPSRMEDINMLINDKDGKEVTANTFLFVDYKKTLSYENKIILKTKNGQAHPLATKEMVIKKLEKVSGFALSHYEVYL